MTETDAMRCRVFWWGESNPQLRRQLCRLTQNKKCLW
jgi:hypothetical protein